MSDGLQFLVDERLGITDAERAAAVVRKKLVSEGWVVAAKRHPPGPKVRGWYALASGEVDFTTLRANGVTIEVGPSKYLARAGRFLAYESDDRHPESHIRPLGAVVCGNLALTFHNWPPLDSVGWTKSIIDVLEETLGTRPTLARARL